LVSDLDRNESRFEERTRASFEASVANLDGRTRSRLNQARQRAVDAAQARPKWMKALIPATGVAAAAVLAVMLQVNPSIRSQSNGATVALEDLDIVSDADNLDLMQDLDFYAWMPQGPQGDAQVQ
jgi:negative regulator of sigma E activity